MALFKKEFLFTKFLKLIIFFNFAVGDVDWPAKGPALS